MAIGNGVVRVRAGESLTQAWGSVRLRTTLAGDPSRIRSGDSRPLVDLVALRGSSIQLPAMTAIPGMSGKMITVSEITVDLFNQVMKGYEITGHNAAQLKALLADEKAAGTALTYVSLLDAREFAKRLSDQTGRKFRVQTEEEWSKARGQLSGNNWTWTETPYNDRTYVLRLLSYGSRNYDYPGLRYHNDAVRLVEDLAA